MRTLAELFTAYLVHTSAGHTPATRYALRKFSHSIGFRGYPEIHLGKVSALLDS